MATAKVTFSDGKSATITGTREEVQAAVQEYERELSGGVVPPVNEAPEEEEWQVSNIDTTPMPHPFYEKGRKLPGTRPGVLGVTSEEIANPKIAGYGEFVPYEADSPEGRALARAKQGVDFEHGIDGLLPRLKLAKAFDKPEEKAIVMQAVLDDMGVDYSSLPQGVKPIRWDPDVGGLVFLRPLENGKWRWTAADEANVTAEDMADWADPSELLPAVAAAGVSFFNPAKKVPGLGKVATSKRAEILADYFGRSMGNTIEYLMSSGAVTPEDLEEKLGTSGIWKSTVDVVAGRAMLRSVDALHSATEYMPWWGSGNLSPVRNATDRGLDDVARRENVNVAADAMETLHQTIGTTEAAGPRFHATAGQATGDKQVLIDEQAIEAQLPENASKALAGAREESRSALQLYNETIHSYNNRDVDLPDMEQSFTPPDLVGATQESLARRQALDVAAARSKGDVVSTRHKGTGMEVEGDPGALEVPGGSRISYKLQGFDEADVHLDVLSYVDETTGVETRRVTDALNKLGAGGETTGQAMNMYTQAIDEAFDEGAEFGSDMVVSKAAQRVWETKLPDAGYQIELHPAIKADPNNPRYRAKDGSLHSPDGEPVYRVTATTPEAAGREFFERAAERMDRNYLEAGLDERYNMLDDLTVARDDALIGWQQTIGWDEATQRSLIYVRNTDQNAIAGVLKKLQARNQHALTQGVADPSVRMMQDAMRMSAKGEAMFDGNSGLLSERLDLGQLFASREHMASIDDPLAREMTAALDSVIQRGTYTNRVGKPMPRNLKSEVYAQYKDYRTLNRNQNDLANELNANALYQRAPDGSYLNTSVDALDKMTRMGNRNFDDVVKVARQSPEIKGELQQGLFELYNRKVLQGPNGFDRKAHDRFMGEREDALRQMFGAEDFARFKHIPEHFRQTVNAGKKARAEMMETWGTAAKQAGLDPSKVKLNAFNLNASFNKMGSGMRRRLMRQLDRDAPELAFELRRMHQRQVKDQISKTWLTGESTPNKAKGFEQWLNTNRASLTDLHGEQYVQDLTTMKTLFLVDARRNSVPKARIDAQGTMLRYGRSLIGPLSKPQRFATAASYNRTRMNATMIMQTVSDPRMLRELVISASVPAASRPGFRVAQRLGWLSMLGIDQVGDEDAQYNAYLEHVKDSTLNYEEGRREEIEDGHTWQQARDQDIRPRRTPFDSSGMSEAELQSTAEELAREGKRTQRPGLSRSIGRDVSKWGELVIGND